MAIDPLPCNEDQVISVPLKRITPDAVMQHPEYIYQTEVMELPVWQKIVKRIADIILSVITIIICLPVALVLAVAIKLSGRGPVIFRQERIGRGGKPFTLLKFRTMIDDAEPDGPVLSNPDDPRVTPVGRFMRKHKIDELPNFLNVIAGDMSIVGPRPERSYYIDILRERNTRIDLLFTIRPGITCLGQVKFGYASDIDQMIERLEYELDYIKNASLRLDLEIMWLTLGVLIRGRKNDQPDNGNLSSGS